MFCVLLLVMVFTEKAILVNIISPWPKIFSPPVLELRGGDPERDGDTQSPGINIGCRVLLSSLEVCLQNSQHYSSNSEGLVWSQH